MIPKATLGRTGLEVSRLGFGAMDLRGLAGEAPSAWSGLPSRLPNEEHAGKVLNAALDAGINFIDTAPSYGRSEEFIGRFVSHRRKEFFLATKCGNYWRDDPDWAGWSPKTLRRSIDESLRRLKTDCVDLLQLHNPTVEEAEESGCIETIQEIQAQGKTRFIGISTVLPRMETFLNLGIFDTFQLPYSLLQPEHGEIISKAAHLGAGTIIRGGMGEGVPAGGHPTRTGYDKLKNRWVETGTAALAPDLEPAELMLRYTLSHPDIHTVIVGTQNLEHLAANVLASERGSLEPTLVQELRRRAIAEV